MFSRNCLLSVVFTVVVLCTTIPQDTVEAKDSFVRRAEVAQQEHEQSSTVGGQLTIGSRHRVMEQDTATTAPKSGGTDIFTTLFAWTGLFFKGLAAIVSIPVYIFLAILYHPHPGDVDGT